MFDLMLVNVTYTSYRLLFTAPLVKVLSEKYGYYWAVLIMAQLSFYFDFSIFDVLLAHTSECLSVFGIVSLSSMYTTRVVIAWWLIARIERAVNNYWVAVVAGSELTFFADFYIFGTLDV